LPRQLPGISPYLSAAHLAEELVPRDTRAKSLVFALNVILRFDLGLSYSLAVISVLEASRSAQIIGDGLTSPLIEGKVSDKQHW
jgi:hypothetical protein